jgi:hypothetical protein
VVRVMVRTPEDMSTLAPLVHAVRAALGEIDSIARLVQRRIEVSMERLLE